jgi:hypothetical protein
MRLEFDMDRMGRFLAIVIVAAFALSISATLDAQSKAAGNTHEWVAPRTAWGDPDLEGIWPSNEMLGTPLERPTTFGERNTLTEEEYAARQTQSQRQAEADGEQFVNTQAPSRGTGTGPPSHWGERGKPSRQASLIVEPKDGRLPPMTPAGEKRKNLIRSTYWHDFPGVVEQHPFNSFEDLGPYDRCISRGLLASMLPTGYNMGTQIFQFPGYVVINNEMIHETRVIPLDGRPHVDSKITSWMGNSRGHWEGDTLVIESTNFNAKVGLTLNGNSTPTSQKLKIVERLTRVDANTIQYQATVDDAETWTRPWTVSLPYKQQPEYGMYEYACHEGNFGMRNILSGARAEESESARDKGQSSK